MPVQIKGVGSIDGLDQGLDVGIVTAIQYLVPIKKGTRSLECLKVITSWLTISQADP